MNKTEPQKKLSISRILIAILIVTIFFYYLLTNLQTKLHKDPEEEIINTYKPWFAAYVDVTSTPTYSFEQISSSPTSDVVLSFIVASKTDDCTPTWGTFYTLDEAAKSLDLDRRIARLQQQGGKIAISFGGALNDELSLRCKDEEKLLDAYQSVIDRYNVDTVDLDLENQGLTDVEAMIRRAKVMAELQKIRKEKNKDLAIWLTLPVAPQGLTTEGTDAVAQMLLNQVNLSGVNIMTMDYGGSKEENQTMLEASILAVKETHRQIGILYEQAGQKLGPKSLYRKLGATPMIGQNDVRDEVFTLEDAKGLNQFAVEQGLGRMSMWSANRDIMCGENYVDIKIVSDSCSGVHQEKYIFAKLLSNQFEGDLTQSNPILKSDTSEIENEIVDDPENSPYQIWKPTGAYPKGTKVVWHKNVYEAKWWTKNDLPDNPVLQYWETPWQLIGPVMPGDKPIAQPTLPKGTYPEWSGIKIYNGGERVLFEGIPFQAKWWTQGDSPAASEANPDTSPWLPLTQEQINQILNETR